MRLLPTSRHVRVALPLLLVACALLAYDRTDASTRALGGASRRLFDAHHARMEQELNPDRELPGYVSDEALARLVDEARGWRARQTAWALASYTVAVGSMAVFVLRRRWLSVGECLLCLLLAYQCHWLAGIRF
jgi:hypothetical protein